MAGIRGTNTKPELFIRHALHARGFRYRLHPRDVPGVPDFILPRWRAAVFVHGCFWHGHDCPLFRLPGTRPEFWLAKIERNRVRDAEVTAALAAQGWRQLVIWECAMRGRGRMDAALLIEDAAQWITGESEMLELRGAG